MTKNLTVEMTFGQAVALYDVLKAVHADSDWTVERTLKRDLADLAENTWAVNDAERSIEKRANVAALITLITGEPYGDPTEAERIAEVRKALNAYQAQPELADA